MRSPWPREAGSAAEALRLAYQLAEGLLLEEDQHPSCPLTAGWTGNGCHIRLRRPCTAWVREWGLEQLDPGPANLTAYRPPNNPLLTGRSSMCAGSCDKDMAMCYCPAHTPYGHIPAADDALPGACVAGPGRGNGGPGRGKWRSRPRSMA